MAEHGCEQISIVATESCRRAKNIFDFTSRVQSELGLMIRIITGEEEAKLIHLACQKEFSHLGFPFMVLDIGGGSTELIIDDGKNKTINSFPFGAVTLTEKFLFSDPPIKTEIKKLRKYVSNLLNEWSESHLQTTNLYGHGMPCPYSEQLTLIAPAGTPTTLCALHKKLNTYDPNQVHGSTMTKDDLGEIIRKLQRLSLEKRAQLPCLPLKRADVIIAGAHILDVVLGNFQIDSLCISDHGLAFGNLYDHSKTWVYESCCLKS